MLFLRRESKWDEVAYADMFFTPRNHPEWQKECGINLAPQDSLVLALEKEKRGKGERLRGCYSACSTGERCLKVRETRERLEDYVPRYEKEREQGNKDEQFPINYLFEEGECQKLQEVYWEYAW